MTNVAILLSVIVNMHRILLNKIPLTFIEVGHHRGIQHLKTTKET